MVDETFLDRFHRLGAAEGEEYGPAVARKLSLLIRPALVAGPGKVFSWCDWSAIEARKLPWLAASRGAEQVLDIFRANDADPDAPDIYRIEAGNIFGKDPRDIGKGAERQTGKVAVLSLGFGGALGALKAMATNYGIYLDDATAMEIVAKWRANNPWARRFWDELWQAATNAVEHPDTIFTAGRVAYVFDKTYLGGSLFCSLPCGRWLTYPALKCSKELVVDRQTKKPVEPVQERWQLTYRKGYGRSALWYGKLAENVTQASAGSLLRGKLTLLEREESDWMPVVGHTHDEIVVEVDEADGDDAKRVLHEVMTENDDWNAGLPLAAEATSSWFYSKAA